MNENLRTYIIPEGPTELGFGWDDALRRDPAYRAAEYIVVPEGVTTVCGLAFRSLDRLQAIRIPRSVLTIRSGAFQGCEKLSRILVDTGNPTFCDVDGVVFSKDGTRLIRMPEGREEDCYVVPDSVTAVGPCAFAQCKALRKIEIPDSVRDIGYMAFIGCTALRSVRLPQGLEVICHDMFQGCTCLESIHIPASVKVISPGVFVRCTALKSITVAPENEAYCVEDGTLFDKGRHFIIKMPPRETGTHYVVPEGVTNIVTGAFSDSTGLESIHIPASVRWILSKAFLECNSLKHISVDEANNRFCSVDGILYDRERKWLIKVPQALPARSFAVPEGVKTIGDRAFMGCAALREIHLPDSVRTISDLAFLDCTSLREADIPESVTFIGSIAFLGCEKLQTIRCRIDLNRFNDEDWGGLGSESLYADATLCVPAAAMEAYRRHPEFGRFRRIEPLPHV